MKVQRGGMKVQYIKDRLFSEYVVCVFSILEYCILKNREERVVSSTSEKPPPPHTHTLERVETTPRVYSRKYMNILLEGQEKVLKYIS